MIVYIEYVLIDNFVIDYLLLKATFAITGFPCHKGRLFLCAFLGALFALLYPLVPVHSIVLAIVKVLFGLLIILCSAKFSTRKRAFVSTLIFTLLTFLVGGTILGLTSMFNVGAGNEFLVSVIIVPAYLIIKLIVYVIKSLYKQKTIKSLTYKTEITAFGKTIKTLGFLDTGNVLFYKDSPVIVCSKSFFKENLLCVNALKTAMEIEISTVSGKSKMLAIKIDSLKIYIGEIENIFNNVVLCASKGEVSLGADIILHPFFMEVGCDKRNDFQTKKVS